MKPFGMSPRNGFGRFTTVKPKKKVKVKPKKKRDEFPMTVRG